LLALLVLITIGADYLSGPAIHFPIFYLLPIVFVSWFGLTLWSYGLALTLPLIRIFFGVLDPQSWHSPALILNVFIRVVVFLAFVYLVRRTARQHRMLQREVQMLTGLLPICSFCKRIRDDSDTWVQLEQYISNHSEAEFSHSICSDCLRQYYPDYKVSIPPTNQG